MPVIERRRRIHKIPRAQTRPRPLHPDQSDEFDGLRAARGCLYSLLFNIAIACVVVAVIVLR
jgi:hypothetical protein